MPQGLRVHAAVDVTGWIVTGFLAVQAGIIWLDTNGPFVDEGLYTVAGLRVLEGQGLSDGYLTWFNGSPFVWPVIAALGHHLGGFPGARLAAALVSTVTLFAFAKTAENLFGPSVARWCALAFGVNGLFLALAHFAVYDVAALAGLALAMWCVSRPSRSPSVWMIAGALAFAGAVIAKYGYLPMIAPLLGLLVSVRGGMRAGRALALFLSVAGVILAAYFWIIFGSLVPTSSATYLGQTFGRTRGHIAVLQVVFALVPLVLGVAGAIVAWRRGRRVLAVTCLLALSIYPAFHLWTANFVSAQKHVVAGFLFAYLLAGLALERLWTARSRRATVLALVVMTTWGGLQCYWQDHSWSDTRKLANHLAQSMQRGERVVAESSWAYIVHLYPRGLIATPAEVIDANYPPRDQPLELCQIPWMAGNPENGLIRDTVARCGHRPVLTSITSQYYVDTARLRLGVSPVVVGLYRLPRP